MQNIFLIIKMSCVSIFGTIVIIGSIIGGSIDINRIPSNFDISISNVKIDNKNITETAVYKNQITFETSELQKRGDASLLEYEISNNSKYDASLKMECTKNGQKSDYYIIDTTTPEIIKSNSKEKANIKVTLVKESLTDSKENFSCTLEVNAIEKH